MSTKTEKIFKKQGKSNLLYIRELPKKTVADFPAETLQARREWHDIFKVVKIKKPTTKNTLLGMAIIQI